MGIWITADVPLESIIDQLDHVTAKELIIAADEKAADFGFTVDIIKTLIVALEKECAADGENLDMSIFYS